MMFILAACHEQQSHPLYHIISSYNYLCINILNLRIRDRCYELVTALVSVQMPKNKDKKKKDQPGLQTSISPVSTDAEGAPADAFDGAALSDSEHREAASGLSTDEVAQLRAKIAILESRVQTAHMDGRGATAPKLTVWRYKSMWPIPADIPTMDRPASLLPFRRAIFDWLGAHSFVLRLSGQERKMLDDTDLALLRANRKAFIEAWAPSSLTHLQHDVYSELKKHLSRSILVTHIFTQVTSEHSDCATQVWDALILAFHPHSHQVVSAMVAEAASTILRGPDHNTADPAKAFRKWDAAVSSLNQSALDLPPLDAKMLSTCLMEASLAWCRCVCCCRCVWCRRSGCARGRTRVASFK